MIDAFSGTRWLRREALAIILHASSHTRAASPDRTLLSCSMNLVPITDTPTPTSPRPIARATAISRLGEQSRLAALWMEAAAVALVREGLDPLNLCHLHVICLNDVLDFLVGCSEFSRDESSVAFALRENCPDMDCR
jgi:hypothetical protein